MIPNWLSEKDNYTAIEDKNTYVQKSIFSIIEKVAIIRENKNGRINPALKVICTIVMIICTSISRSFIYFLLVDIYLLAILFLLGRKRRKPLIIRSIIFPVITLIALLPSMFYGNIYNSIVIFQKLIITILLVNILAHTTKWTEISKALKLLLVPDIFLWTMDITIKYIVVLGEYAINLLYALKLRAIGRTKDKYKALTSIMGNLFMNSYKMSEEMFNAMECRGFSGEYKAKVSFKFKAYDYLYLTINIVITCVGIILYALKLGVIA